MTLVDELGLQPHPEGGWFRETWRAPASVTLPGWTGQRATATGILYLLRAGETSRWHRVRGDELWLWHRGGPLLLTLGGSGDAPASNSPESPSTGTNARTVTLGADAEREQRPQVLVPGGHWQCARPAADREVLVSCVVSPGFDYADFDVWADTRTDADIGPR